MAIIRYHGVDYMIANAALEQGGEVTIDMSPPNEAIATTIRKIFKEKQLHALDFRALEKALAES